MRWSDFIILLASYCILHVLLHAPSLCTSQGLTGGADKHGSHWEPEGLVKTWRKGRVRNGCVHVVRAGENKGIEARHGLF